MAEQVYCFKGLNEEQRALLKEVYLEVCELDPDSDVDEVEVEESEEEEVVAEAVGVGVPIPPFLISLLKSVGFAKGLEICAQGVLMQKHQQVGWGRNQQVGYEEKIGDCNARGAIGDISWTKTGDRKPKPPEPTQLPA